jgi:excisionase family DNA binding protein
MKPFRSAYSLVTAKLPLPGPFTIVKLLRQRWVMTKHDTATPQVEPLLVRVEEAARILSLSRSTIYEMLDRGEISSIRCGAARRIPMAALRAWVDQQLAHDIPNTVAAR